MITRALSEEARQTAARPHSRLLGLPEPVLSPGSRNSPACWVTVRSQSGNTGTMPGTPAMKDVVLETWRPRGFPRHMRRGAAGGGIHPTATHPGECPVLLDSSREPTPKPGVEKALARISSDHSYLRKDVKVWSMGGLRPG